MPVHRTRRRFRATSADESTREVITCKGSIAGKKKCERQVTLTGNPFYDDPLCSTYCQRNVQAMKTYNDSHPEDTSLLRLWREFTRGETAFLRWADCHAAKRRRDRNAESNDAKTTSEGSLPPTTNHSTTKSSDGVALLTHAGTNTPFASGQIIHEQHDTDINSVHQQLSTTASNWSGNDNHDDPSFDAVGVNAVSDTNFDDAKFDHKLSQLKLPDYEFDG
ncbi:uncharacterized protein IL334_007846 [Kwoniella shivajii]|uniref:RTR1-type domain-containing protein n=1 Tax=Kwoniella shivajii TaxID=564305 RepID=A0ABZ1DB75_9TREE|nr:hypothetical protein IL334_007846 [Kwoniella shivajii]